MTTENPSGLPRLVNLPKAKDHGIVIQKFDNETLAYDLQNDKAHHLNESVSEIWNFCDGKTSVSEMASRIERRRKIEIEEDFVMLALHELEKANLLETASYENDFSKVSRRKVLFKYAPIAVALPIVMSLVAPPAVSAQSCVPIGNPCMTPADCCPPTADIFCVGIPLTCQNIAE